MREFLTILILSLSSFILSFSACLSDFVVCNSCSNSLIFCNEDCANKRDNAKVSTVPHKIINNVIHAR